MTPAPSIALGIGCDRGTSESTLEAAVREALALACADAACVRAVASISLKADEAGLLAWAASRRWVLRFYAPEELAAVPVPHPSEVVRAHTGTPSVSEAAALLAAGTGAHDLIVEKLKRRGADGRHATVSIARFPT